MLEYQTPQHPKGPHSARDLPAGQDLHDGLEGVAGGGEVGAHVLLHFFQLMPQGMGFWG